MANFFKDNDDLQYYFDKGVDWDSLVQITEHDFAEADGEGFKTTEEALDFYRDIVEMFGEFVAEEIKPVSYTHLTLPTIVRECRSRWAAVP